MRPARGAETLARMNGCAICGKDLQDSLTIEWEAMPGIQWHANCDWTVEGRAWFDEQRRLNPRLDRQVQLRTMGLGQVCVECGHEQSVNPTAIGMNPSSWDVNCTACGESWHDAINGYSEPEVWAELWRLRSDFELGEWDATHEEALVKLDSHLRNAPQHSCGPIGRFSFTARVRCLRCASTLPVESWFHYGFRPSGR